MDPFCQFRASFEYIVYQQYYYRSYLRRSETYSNWTTRIITIATSGCVLGLINEKDSIYCRVPFTCIQVSLSFILGALVFLVQLINIILPTFHWERQIALTNLMIPELEDVMYRMGAEMSLIKERNEIEYTIQRIVYYEGTVNDIIHHYIPNEQFPDLIPALTRRSSKKRNLKLQNIPNKYILRRNTKMSEHNKPVGTPMPRPSPGSPRPPQPPQPNRPPKTYNDAERGNAPPPPGSGWGRKGK